MQIRLVRGLASGTLPITNLSFRGQLATGDMGSVGFTFLKRLLISTQRLHRSHVRSTS